MFSVLHPVAKLSLASNNLLKVKDINDAILVFNPLDYSYSLWAQLQDIAGSYKHKTESRYWLIHLILIE